jgi:hypothetical protein
MTSGRMGVDLIGHGRCLPTRREFLDLPVLLARGMGSLDCAIDSQANRMAPLAMTMILLMLLRAQGLHHIYSRGAGGW